MRISFLLFLVFVVAAVEVIFDIGRPEWLPRSDVWMGAVITGAAWLVARTIEEEA